MTKLNKLEKFFRFLIYILPGALFFSYYPLFHFGSDESMNFEISLPMIWLILFDFLAVFLLIKRKLLKKIVDYWAWLILPGFLTISVFWSLNPVRGLLTVGILWLIYFAVFSFWQLKDLFSEDSFREKFWKVFFGSTLVICVWCLVQCILDIAGVSRDYSLMCAGCTYQMFGFPHPNGFAIEPQFMGNLLLAPAIMSGWLILRSRPRPAGPSARAAGANSRAAALRNAVSLKHYTILFLALTTTLFLTFSRGAIYAFAIAMIILTIICQSSKMLGLGHTHGRSTLRVVRVPRGGLAKLTVPNQTLKTLTKMWLVIIFAFVIAINMQGVMAEVGPTNDTYKSGVAKVLNHLSLGVIDIREQKDEINNDTDDKNGAIEEALADEENQEAVFDGYVAESTDTRMRLTNAAITVWSKDIRTVLFGVGLGGAGRALYNNSLSPAPKEIIQNEYASLLLETGLIGIALLAITIVLIIRVTLKSKIALPLLVIMVAYGISLCFFSGLPNALQIYLLPAAILSLYGKN